MFLTSPSPDLGPLTPSEKYARLSDTASLHLSPTYGVVNEPASGASIFVQRETKEILLACDGTRRVADLVDRAVAADPGAHPRVVLALAELVRLAGRNLLQLDSEPRLHPPRVTGDLGAFYPLNLQVELTEACNLRCFYCYRRSGSRRREKRLPTSQLLHVLGTLRRLGLESVELTGGEPMGHPDWAEILRFCAETFDMVSVLTNGTYLSPRRVAAMRPYRDHMIFSVSLDSHVADVHDRRRGVRGAFAATTEGVRLLVKEGFLTRVSMVVDGENWHDVEQTLLFARGLGATMFTYTPLLPIGRGQSHFNPWEPWAGYDPLILHEEERALRERYSGFLQVLPEESVFDLEQPGGCGAGFRTYAMDPIGRVRPCVTFSPDTAVFGSLRSDSPAEVFGGPLAYAFATITPPQPDVCGSCPFRMYCQGCSLRGEMASGWLSAGECAWLRQPAPRDWFALVRQHMVGAPTEAGPHISTSDHG
jgi:antilisterial bacteriocin subtilosin biosynthesis protein AlbA